MRNRLPKDKYDEIEIDDLPPELSELIIEDLDDFYPRYTGHKYRKTISKNNKDYDYLEKIYTNSL